MDDDRFDDGLVHSHDWAREKPEAPAKPQAAREVIRTARDDRYDDGLVHGHGWASGGK